MHANCMVFKENMILILIFQDFLFSFLLFVLSELGLRGSNSKDTHRKESPLAGISTLDLWLQRLLLYH